MSTKAKAGAKSQLQLGDGASPEVFSTIAEVLTMKKSASTVETDDATNQDSPTDTHGMIMEEVITTIKKSGELDVTFNFVPGAITQLRNAFDGQPHDFKLVFPILNTANSPATNWTFAFTGIVTSEDEWDVQITKKITGSGKIKITGAYTLS